MNDRIKLAEVMGWTRMVAHPTIGSDNIAIDNDPYWIPPETDEEPKPNYGDLEELPDPFTDANDDYAVLEWMRNSELPIYTKMISALECPPKSRRYYLVGDYARAALKVLE